MPSKETQERADPMAPKVMPGGSYIRIPYGSDEGGADDGTQSMTWPNPANGVLSYALRSHRELTRSERLVAASILDAYRHLTIEPSMTQKERNRRIASIRAALDSKGADSVH